eukprot:9553347-Heterocapsa_arctica.AAC.1
MSQKTMPTLSHSLFNLLSLTASATAHALQLQDFIASELLRYHVGNPWDPRRRVVDESNTKSWTE